MITIAKPNRVRWPKKLYEDLRLYKHSDDRPLYLYYFDRAGKYRTFNTSHAWPPVGRKKAVFVVTKTNRWVYNYFGAEKERWLVKLGNRFVTQNLMHLQHFIGTFYAQESERVFGTKRYAYIDGKYYAVPRRDGLPEHIAGRPVEFFELRQDGCIFRWRKNKLQKITHE